MTLTLTCPSFACRYLTLIAFLLQIRLKISIAALTRDINMVKFDDDFQDILRQLHLPEDVRDALLQNCYGCTLTFGLAFSSMQMLDQHISKFLPSGETDFASPTCARIRGVWTKCNKLHTATPIPPAQTFPPTPPSTEPSSQLNATCNWLQSEMSQDITAEEKRAFQKKWLEKRECGGQGFLCRLCGKETWGGPGCQHLTSTQHVEKETEEILLDRLFGSSAGRRLGEGCHIPTKAAVRAYWGQNVENLTTILEAKMQAGEEIRFRYGKSAKSASHVVSNKIRYRFHLAIIKYSETTGNYHNNTYSCNDVRLWNLLPEVEDEETQRRYEKNQKKGDKWWPVIMCQVDGEPDGPYEGIVGDYVYVIICFYQILQKLMNAWCVAFQEMQEVINQIPCVPVRPWPAV